MNWFYNMKIGAKIISGFISIAVIAGLIGVVGIRGIRTISNESANMYNNQLLPISYLSEISTAFQRARVNIRDLVHSETPAEMAQYQQQIKAFSAIISKNIEAFEKVSSGEEEKKMLAEFAETRKVYRPLLDRITQLALAGKIAEANTLMVGDARVAAKAEQAAMDKLEEYKIKMAKTTSENNLTLAKTSLLLSVLFLVVGIILAIGLGIFIARAITRPVNDCVEAANKIAAGDTDVHLDTSRTDETGVLQGAMQRMVVAVNALIADTAMLSKAAVEGKLATRAEASKHQGDFRKVVEGVNQTLDSVIGPLNVAAEYVDRISKGDIPPRITDSYQGDFNEIKNNLNQAIDAVNALVSDAGMLSKAAVEGKLATRADASKHRGDFQKVVAGVNETLDSVIGPLNVAAEYVDRISKGDIPPKITDSYHGDFNELKNNLNTCIDAVNALVNDSKMLSTAAVQGKLAARADASRHQGDFQLVVEGVNQTLDAVIGPMNVAAEYVDRISKGDIPPRITETYNGDFNEIKNNLNVLIEAMEDVTRISEKIALGDLAVEVTPRSKGDLLMLALKDMVQHLKELAQSAEQIAAGDLTISVQPASDRDVMGSAFVVMIDNLREIVGNVNSSTGSIATASRQIAAGNADLAQRTEEQAASLEETAASMEELTSTVKQNADNSQQANQLAIVASDVAVKGGSAIEKVVVTMDSISDSSKKIADIIGVIDGIAFQTNILALNAAVEAARAGEQGRGFAVVAGEVRNLAQRSAAAAKEIKSLISDSVGKVDSGSKLVGEAGQTMREIVTSIKRVTDIMGEISAASLEQSTGIEQVNIAVTTMDEMTQQNSAVVQQASSAADSLEEQAQLLVEAVSRFKLEDSRNIHGVEKRSEAPLHTLKLNKPSKAQAKKAGGSVSLQKRGNEQTQQPMAKAVGDDTDWNGF
jgi:methyl-accepting chemotaxis protein